MYLMAFVHNNDLSIGIVVVILLDHGVPWLKVLIFKIEAARGSFTKFSSFASVNATVASTGRDPSPSFGIGASIEGLDDNRSRLLFQSLARIGGSISR